MSKKHPKTSKEHVKDLMPKVNFSFLEEFKQFALKGDMIDLAVGIIIGTGFNSLVQSLVNDIIMPIFGWVLGGSQFADLYIQLGNQSFSSLAEAQAAGAPVILYGKFISQTVDFIIIALTVFVVLRYFLRMKQQENPA